eukprot:CAMPEP_0170350974 /NCGR_PEP_ID=MMETSP0116_2-20130129/76785_1 /TAXON_ID=400756 /ORGANISM="Durinskia baltica, Strain CSIRO CS-38" /LENGTH=288 /DNA_ID=CAMNT_0010604873 /DNA_START=3 /DNA_END=866 /DNA_ORIENTATION=+
MAEDPSADGPATWESESGVARITSSKGTLNRTTFNRSNFISLGGARPTIQNGRISFASERGSFASTCMLEPSMNLKRVSFTQYRRDHATPDADLFGDLRIFGGAGIRASSKDAAGAVRSLRSSDTSDAPRAQQPKPQGPVAPPQPAPRRLSEGTHDSVPHEFVKRTHIRKNTLRSLAQEAVEASPAALPEAGKCMWGDLPTVSAEVPRLPITQPPPQKVPAKRAESKSPCAAAQAGVFVKELAKVAEEDLECELPKEATSATSPHLITARSWTAAASNDKSGLTTMAE